MSNFEEYIQNPNDDLVISSPIPQVCKYEEVMIGIDEAGRGPVLASKEMQKMDFADSKQLTEEKREEIFNKLVASFVDKVSTQSTKIGWFTKILSPTTISNGNFRRSKYNLNTLSHDTAIELINLAIASGVNVTEIYVDTVGPKDKYQAKLKSIFPDVAKIRVENKADSLFHVVSAASICAKVTRDRVLSSWKFPEERISASQSIKEGELGQSMTCEQETQSLWVNYGSGYPGDPKTKAFLSSTLDPVFGFPTFVRFSWSTIKNILEEKGVEVIWEADEDQEEEEEEEGKKSVPITNYFKRKDGNEESPNPAKKSKVDQRHPFFAEANLTRPSSLF